MKEPTPCNKCSDWCEFTHMKVLGKELFCDECYDNAREEGIATCPRCGGDGYDRCRGLLDPMVPCPECYGHGEVTK